MKHGRNIELFTCDHIENETLNILGDTRSTLNGVICWAIFNVIGKVFPFPSPFLGDLMQKPSNNYSFL